MAARWASAAHPFLYEINTWPWLARAERRRRSAASTSAACPTSSGTPIADAGFDAVWLMGVWERSPAGVAVALADADLVAGFRAALADYATRRRRRVAVLRPRLRGRPAAWAARRGSPRPGPRSPGGASA